MAKPRTRPRGSTARPKPTAPHHSKPSDLGRRIVRDPKVLGGKPTVRGTRVAVDLLLEKLAQGVSPDAILDDFPFLEPDDVRAALWYAVHVLRDEIEYLEQSA